MPRTTQIPIRYAALNEAPEVMRVRKGTTVSELAEEKDLRVTDLFVNGQKVRGSYVLEKDDFVVLVGNIRGGQ